MPKYNVIVECSNACGIDLHGWRVDASNPIEAGYIATQLAQSHYPEFDEFEPVRTEAVR